jgi:hypothetical protein
VCLVLYAAGPKSLPAIEWNEVAPAFYVREVDASDVVRTHFDFPHVYELGSHEGCGCGFGYRDYSASPEDGEPYRRSAAALSQYLCEARRQGPVQVFASWSGEEGQPHGERALLTPELAASTEHWSDVQAQASSNEVFAFNFETDGATRETA